MNRHLQNRRRPRHRLAIDLFPFLGIIVCVIGIVVLLVSAMVAAGSIHESDQRAGDVINARLRAAQRLRDAEEEIRAQTSQRQALTRRIEEAKALDRTMAERKLRAKELEKKLEAAEVKEAMELMQRIALAKIAQERLATEVAELGPKLKDANKELENAAAVVAIPLLPGAEKVKPVFIECHLAGITIFRPGEKNLEEISIPLDDIRSSNRLSSLAEDVAADARKGGNQVVNFLVRPDGVSAYDRARPVLQRASAPSSSVPLVAKGKIQFRVQAANQPPKEGQESPR